MQLNRIKTISSLSRNTQQKIANSIALLQKAERLALQYSEEGFYLAFSGGKDSQVVYQLCLLAGVKFKAHMQLTSVDPPQLLSFIRKYYPSVQLHPPKESMYTLIVRKKCLPMRNIRYCCSELKEHAGIGCLTVLGIRAQESTRRAKRKEFDFNRKDLTLDQFNINQEQLAACTSGKDKVLLCPILRWTHTNVWELIRAFKLPYCELYDMGYTRVGCVFCPMASRRSKQRDRILFAGIEKAYKKAIQQLVLQHSYASELKGNVDDIFDWWISNQSIKQFKAGKSQLKLRFNDE